MPNYKFVAKDNHGRSLSGSLFGATEQAVFFRLQQLGYVVLSVTEKEQKEQFEILAQKVGIEDVVLFARLFSAVIDAGLPVADSLAALEEQTENKSFKKIIRKIREDVEQGTALSAAFEKYPEVFPHFFVSMVRSGESGGNLAEVLIQISRYLERDHDLHRGIRAAFTYPKFVVTLMGLLMIIVFFKVLPVMANFYKEAPASVKIPRATKLLLDFSTLINENWMAFAAGLIFAIGGILIFKHSPQTRPIYDNMALNLPVMGPINKRLSISRSLRALGSMLYCGVPLITSLENAKTLLNNKAMEIDMERVIESVESGGTMSSPLRISKNFPALAVYMISVGEHSGRLPELLHGCSEAIDKEIDHLIKQLLVALEPALIVLIAIMVAFVAIALYLPVFTSLTSFQ